MSWFRDQNFRSSAPVLQEIIYQMVDGKYPLSTEQFQEAIEINPMIKGKTKLVIKNRIRYIHINVDAYMEINEILNLGKRIAIIEQDIIRKSKILCNNTINKNDISKQAKMELTDNQLAIVALDNIEKIISNNQFAAKHNESLTVTEISLNILKVVTDFRKDTEKFIKKVIKQPIPKYGTKR